MTDIKVSVLTSLYKHKPEYVRQCLDSLVEQTLRECEFILIDNGADENNKALIKEYLEKDARFKAIYLDTNIGMGTALNRGMEASKGEYIGFLESDDFAEPEMFADLYAKSNNGQLDIVKSLFNTLDEKGNIKLEKTFPDSQLDSLLKKGQCSGLIQGHVSHWSGIYRKEFLKENKIDFNETSGGHSQDFGFILQCYACAKSVYVIPHAYVTYRLFSGVHEFKFLNDCMLDECELTFKKLRKKKLPQEVWEVLFFRIAPRLKTCLQTADKKQKKRIIREITRNSKFQAYKYFPPSVKQEIKQLIKTSATFYKLKYGFLHTYIETPQKTEKKFCGITYFKKKTKQDKTVYSYVANLFRVIEKDKSTRYQFLGIPFVVKKDTIRKQYIKILGIPIYYKEDKQFEIKQQLNALQGKLEFYLNWMQTNINSMKTLEYKSNFFPLCVAEMHTKNLRPYKNIYQDQIVVIVGSGPTLNYYKQIPNAIHIGLNRSFEKEDLSLDYIFAWDLPNLMKNDKLFFQKIKNYPAKKILGRFLTDETKQVNDNLVSELDAITLFSSARHGLPLTMYDETIHYDIEKYPLMDFGSVAFGAFHFALYTGAKKILLVGIDNKLTGYFSTAHQQQFLQTQSILHGWLKVKDFCKTYYPNTEIISVNPIGLSKIFKDVYTQSYVNDHKEQQSVDVSVLEKLQNSILQ